MQLGAVFSHGEIGADVAGIRDWAQAIQDLGYDFAVVSDHVVGAEAAGHPELPRVFGIDSPLHEGRHDSRCQVEDEICEVPEPVLHVIAEHPEEDHVPEDVEPAPMDEQGR